MKFIFLKFIFRRITPLFIFAMLVFAFVFLFRSPSSHDSQANVDVPPTLFPEATGARFVVWNVGQGLWTTLVEKSNDQLICDHFDAGGERAPWKLVTSLCRQASANRFHFSHWDLDHIGFAKSAHRQLHGSCLDDAPAGETNSRTKHAMIDNFPRCPAGEHDDEEIHWTPALAKKRSRKRRMVVADESRTRPSNEASRVFAIHHEVLVSGDSPATQEKIWASARAVQSVSILILGHHGSRTATSDLLLDHLSHAHQAVASARLARYGHPHLIVRARLKVRGIALLTTEDWGHLVFELR